MARRFLEGLANPVVIEDEVAACAELLRDLVHDVHGRHESVLHLVPDEAAPLSAWLVNMETGVDRFDLIRKELAAQMAPHEHAVARDLTRVWMERFALEPHAHFLCPTCRPRLGQG
jgi:hypothetical protein